MARQVRISVEHLTRVEGHGNITLNAKDGTVEKVLWEVTEAPRLFEAFVRGKPYHQMSNITSRICGICSIAHALASLKATENAFNIEISSQAGTLRRLAKHAENMQSHILHVGYLVAPDIFGADSVFPLVKTHPETVLNIVKLHRLANDMSDIICGRTTHPTNLVVGGLWKVPSEIKLKELRQRLIDNIEVYDNLAKIVLANVHKLPDFKRETEYIALSSDIEYALYDGIIGSSDAGKYPVDDYKAVVNEFVVPQSTAKYTKHSRESYMVGALARFNLNYEKLRGLAKQWANKIRFEPMCYNPFMNNIAQMVEYMHSLGDSISLIDNLLNRGLKDERPPKIQPKAGRGIGAVEAPRGILFHDYTYNEKGVCTKANCVIPTNQNHNNIQKDMEVLAPAIIDRPEKEIELSLEMLVRAYDPCISCSTHYLNIQWRR
jgi:sulfhydrogenase subunit alpha